MMRVVAQLWLETMKQETITEHQMRRLKMHGGRDKMLNKISDN
jgi:hypothetical protein